MTHRTMLVTGATGMIGSQVARRAVEQGYRVRALVRRSSDRALLDGVDVELVEGDLAEPESLAPAVRGANVVVHAAAHIGDWGPADKYRAINVVGLEHLLAAARREDGLQRWIHVSSLGVYAARDHYGTDETEPTDLRGLDGYTRTKAEGELVVERYVREERFPAVILRPGFVYGPGERHVIPRLVEKLRAGTMRFIGDGRKRLNNTYVGNLVDAVLLAIDNERAVGETFNVRDERLVDRVEYVTTVAELLGTPVPGRVPLWLARALVGPIETAARLAGRSEAPILTRARVKFMAYNLDFSIDKAKRLLGYAPAVDFQEGIRVALGESSSLRTTGAV